MSGRALLAIDLLNDFLDQWAEDERAKLIHNTNQLIAYFRKLESPVIWVRQEFEPDLSDAFLEMRKKNIKITIKGTSGAEISADLNRHDSDLVIVKKRYSAFFRTPLEDILIEMNIGKLTLCGVNTHACIRMAAIDAYQRDLDVVIASDCISTYDQAHGDMSLKYLDGKISQLKSNGEIMSAIGAG